MLQAEDRGRGDQLVRVIAHARQADADRVPDALRHRLRPGLGQLPQHLLDEERVAVRARVHARRDLVAAEHRASECRHVIERQPAQVDAVKRTAALELAERRRERRVPAELGVAIRAEHEDRSRAARAQQEAREQQGSAIGPVKVVDHEQQRGSRSEVGEGSVDSVEQAMPRAGVVGATAGRQRLGDARLSECFACTARTAPVAPRSSGPRARSRPRSSAADANCWARRVLPTPGSPATSAIRRSRCICTPPQDARSRASSARRPTNTVSYERARPGGGGTGSGSLAAEIVDQRSRLARRRDAELRAQSLGELAAGGQRRGAVAGRGEPLDQSAVGRFRQRVERDLGARQPNRLGWIERRGRGRLERAGEPVRVLLAGLDRPLFVEAVEDRRAARLERPRCIALVEAPAETRARQL